MGLPHPLRESAVLTGPTGLGCTGRCIGIGVSVYKVYDPVQ